MWPKTGLLIPFQIGNTNLIDVFLKTWDISTLSITYNCVHINPNIRLRNSMNLRNGKHKKNNFQSMKRCLYGYIILI